MVTDMKNRLAKNGICFVGLMLALLQPLQLFAGVTMHVTPIGLNSFLLTGDNVDGVAALDVSIGYDPLVLANPRVTSVEGGAMTGIYEGTRGALLVNIDRENPDAPLSLSLNFDNLARARGRGIMSMIAVKAVGRSAGEKTDPASDKITTPAITSAQAGSGKSPVQKLSASVSSAGVNNAAADLRISSALEIEKSVLQRFMEFGGERSVRSFAALFEKSDRDPAQQHPAIALSDGKTPVTITLELHQEEQGSPDIALWDATLVSLYKDGSKSWVATILPTEGTWDVKLIFKVGQEVIELPLVVAPKVTLADGINKDNAQDALNRFCSDHFVEHKWDNVPNLNEYIFTANYLADANSSSSRRAER